MSRFSSRVANRPDGATIFDWTNGASVLGSGSVARIALIHTRAASAITTMMRIANSAARTPSTVELMTIWCISSIDLAGARTWPWSMAAW